MGAMVGGMLGQGCGDREVQVRVEFLLLLSVFFEPHPTRRGRPRILNFRGRMGCDMSRQGRG